MTPRVTPLASALLLALPASALAQSSDQTPDQATDLDRINVEQDRVPIASTPKFTAPLIDTPRSVSVIPQAVIQETAAATLLEALRTVPGITFGAGEGGNPNGDRPFIRGLDAESSIFVDGVRSSGSQSRETFAIDQIEVTKGPSSAYTGRGSVGGSINLVSKTAKRTDFITGSMGVGTDDYARATIDINQTLGDSAAWRIAAMSHRNDIPDRGGPQNKRWGVAPSLAFGLGTDTIASIGYYHLDTDNLPDSGLPYSNPFAADSANAAGNGDGSPIKVAHDTYYGLPDRDFQRGNNDVGTIKLEHHFANAFVLRNTSVWGKSSYDYLWTQPDDSQGNFLLNGGIWRRANSRISETTALTNQTDLSGRFTSGAIAHDFSAGLEIADEKLVAQELPMLLHIPEVLTPEQLQGARTLLRDAAWQDGRATAGHQSAPVKHNQQLADGDPLAAQLRHLILDALGRNATFFSAALPLRILPPFFNRYAGGETFGLHVDNAVRYDHSGPGLPQPLRTDLSATLFFSDPDEYDGGELVIEDTFGTQRIKLPAGHMVLYPGTSLHQVTPVTRGARLASFFWIQSMVREDSQRRLMFDLDSAVRRLIHDVPDPPSLLQLTAVYHNLLRQWTHV